LWTFPTLMILLHVQIVPTKTKYCELFPTLIILLHVQIVPTKTKYCELFPNLKIKILLYRNIIVKEYQLKFHIIWYLHDEMININICLWLDFEVCGWHFGEDENIFLLVIVYDWQHLQIFMIGKGFVFFICNRKVDDTKSNNIFIIYW
jgi:hypothetical protein